jgi:hypothetical protein
MSLLLSVPFPLHTYISNFLQSTVFNPLSYHIYQVSSVSFPLINKSPYFETFMEPRNPFQGMNSASLCSLAGQYDNPIPTRILAPIDCLKIPAQVAFLPQDFFPPITLSSVDFQQISDGPRLYIRTVKKITDFPFPTRESLVSDIPAGDGKISHLFYSVARYTAMSYGSFTTPPSAMSPSCHLSSTYQRLPDTSAFVNHSSFSCPFFHSIHEHRFALFPLLSNLLYPLFSFCVVC